MGNISSASSSLYSLHHTEYLLLYPEVCDLEYTELLQDTNQPDSALDIYYPPKSLRLTDRIVTLPTTYESTSNPTEICELLTKDLAALSCNENVLPIEKQLKLIASSSDIGTRLEAISNNIKKKDQNEKSEKSEKPASPSEPESKISLPEPSDFLSQKALSTPHQKNTLQALKLEPSEKLVEWLSQYSFSVPYTDSGEPEPILDEEEASSEQEVSLDDDVFKQLSVTQLKGYLMENGIDFTNCVEKSDLINEVKSHVLKQTEPDPEPWVLLQEEVDPRLYGPVLEKLAGIDADLAKILKAHKVMENHEEKDKEGRAKSVEKRVAEVTKYEEDLVKAAVAAADGKEKGEPEDASLSPNSREKQAKTREESRKQKEAARAIAHFEKIVPLKRETRLYDLKKEARMFRKLVPLDFCASTKQLLELLMKDGKRLGNILVFLQVLFPYTKDSEQQTEAPSLPIGRLLEGFRLSYFDDDKFIDQIQKVNRLYAALKAHADYEAKLAGKKEEASSSNQSQLMFELCYRALDQNGWSVSSAQAALFKRENRESLEKEIEKSSSKLLKLLREKKEKRESNQILKENIKKAQVIASVPSFSSAPFQKLFPDQEQFECPAFSEEEEEEKKNESPDSPFTAAEKAPANKDGFGGRGRGRGGSARKKSGRGGKKESASSSSSSSSSSSTTVVSTFLGKLVPPTRTAFRLVENVTPRQAVLFLLSTLDRLMEEKSSGLYPSSINKREDRDSFILDSDQLVVPLLTSIFFSALKDVVDIFEKIKAGLLSGQNEISELDETNLVYFSYVSMVAFKLLTYNLSTQPSSAKYPPLDAYNPSPFQDELSGFKSYLFALRKSQPDKPSKKDDSVQLKDFNPRFNELLCWVMSQLSELEERCVVVTEAERAKLAEIESSPKVDKSDSDEVKSDEPAPSDSKSEDSPKPEEQKSEEPKLEEPKPEEAKPEESKAEESAKEEVKSEEPKPEESKDEEPAKSEDAKSEEAKPEEASDAEKIPLLKSGEKVEVRFSDQTPSDPSGKEEVIADFTNGFIDYFGNSTREDFFVKSEDVGQAHPVLSLSSNIFQLCYKHWSTKFEAFYFSVND